MQPNIGLKTFIQDIVNTIKYQGLKDVILVGHSYSGMVITGVAEVIPEFIKELVYVDAILRKMVILLWIFLDRKWPRIL